ncbi:CRAL-TRIO domain-containing protein [Mycena kentingensis (nom. inval.)]|nr:CRAL-TRIO domain-containing protein [Mycena kentingensis (nom. inval.)]
MSDASSSMAGHFGHLTPEQEAKFSEFKVVCTKEGVYVPGTSRASLNDAALLRYLRARKFEVPDALKQLQETEAWRAANRPDELYDTLDVDAYEDARKVYHQWTGRRDMHGRPLYVYEISHLKNNMSAFERSSQILKSPSDASAASTQPIPGKLRTLIGLYEGMSEFILPVCNAVRPHPATPISTTAHIVDISGVGLMGFWNLKGHMQAASQLAQSHYPETLERMYICGAPSFFPTVWGWIKRWFDPNTTSKIHILAAGEVGEALRAVIRAEDLPKKYGGELEWEYGMAPTLDEGIAKALPALKSQWVKGPLRWVESADGTAKVVAKGAVGGTLRDEEVAKFTSTDTS